MEEPPEELRITHRMLDKFLKVDTFTFSANIFFVILLFYIFTISAYLQISGDVSGFDCILVDDMVGVTESFHFSPNSLEK